MADDFYLTPAWRQLRARVLTRDGYRCTVARLLGGRCSGTLHVHHLLSRRERPELALDEDNLISVCAAHHPQVEALREFVRRRRGRRRCRHQHRYDHARRECEARLNAGDGGDDMSLMDMPAWPSAVLFCVRRPLEHQAYYRPLEDYPVTNRSGVLGPVLRERCGVCDALMYIAAVRLGATEETT